MTAFGFKIAPDVHVADYLLSGHSPQVAHLVSTEPQCVHVILCNSWGGFDCSAITSPHKSFGPKTWELTSFRKHNINLNWLISWYTVRRTRLIHDVLIDRLVVWTSQPTNETDRSIPSVRPIAENPSSHLRILRLDRYSNLFSIWFRFLWFDFTFFYIVTRNFRNSATKTTFSSAEH